MFSFFKKQKPVVLSRWEKAIESAKKIVPANMLTVHSSDLSNLKVGLSYSNISEYRYHLSKASRCIESCTDAVRQDFIREKVTTTMSSFFTDKNGNYLDEIRETEMFVDSFITLINLYEGSKTDEALSGGVANYNYRILAELVTESSELIEILLYISEFKRN